MNTVKVRNTVIGEGMPRICVPITGATMEDILSEARMITELPADLVEWRADWFSGVFDWGQMKAVMKALREVLGDMPVLLTFRTAKEGGEKDTDVDTYADINIRAAQSGLIDMIDVEAFTGDEIVRKIIEAAHTEGVKVIASNHDFEKTPDRDEIVNRLCRMQELGADILKIAVMPQSSRDVLTLLAATEEMAEEHADRPIITMSMSGMGLASRLTGEIFGSAVTFGAAARASAPGQIGVKELREMIRIIHEAAR